MIQNINDNKNKFLKNKLAVSDLDKHFTGINLDKAKSVVGTNTTSQIVDNNGNKYWVSNTTPKGNNYHIPSNKQVKLIPITESNENKNDKNDKMITTIKEWKLFKESNNKINESRFIIGLRDISKVSAILRDFGIKQPENRSTDEFFIPKDEVDEITEIFDEEKIEYTLQFDEKLDKVREEDKDINNDGVVDDQDSYLKHKRNTITKAIQKQNEANIIANIDIIKTLKKGDVIVDSDNNEIKDKKYLTLDNTLISEESNKTLKIEHFNVITLKTDIIKIYGEDIEDFKKFINKL